VSEQVKPYPLMTQAIREDDPEKLQELFTTYPDFRDLIVPAFGTWLHYAAKIGAINVMEYLLSNGDDVNTKNREEVTALEQAAAGNQLIAVQLLLSRGASIDIRNAVTNPLFGCIAGSAMDGHPVHDSGNPAADRLEIARLLLDAGLDPKVVYNSDRMKSMDATAFAWMFGRRDIARLIADKVSCGDARTMGALLDKAAEVAELNTKPVS